MYCFLLQKKDNTPKALVQTKTRTPINCLGFSKYRRIWKYSRSGWRSKGI